VETVTESDNPDIAARIREHVKAMYRRVEEGRPIHMRDPLFAEVFRHADKIHMEFKKTKRGIRVSETSDDPYVARLIQAHADVVDLFVKNGFGEPHKNHAVPPRSEATTVSDTVSIPVPTSSAKCGTCPDAEKCASEAKGCAAGECATCPLSDACPAAQQGCTVGGGCAGASAKCASCPNAKKCANKTKRGAVGKCAPCPAGDTCPSAKQD
jgi:hypothetical protein